MSKRRSQPRAVRLTLVALLLIGAHYSGILSPLEKVLVRATEPVYSFFYSKNFEASQNNNKDPESLLVENRVLTNTVEQLKAQLTSYELLVSENEQLRESVTFREEFPYAVQTTKVLSRSSIANPTRLTIALGSDHGAAVGDYVTDAHGRIIGTVITTMPRISYIQLLTHPSVTFAVRNATNSRPIGIARGDLSVSLLVELIPQDVAIVPGDVLVTAAVDGSPDGIRVGIVTSVSDSANELFKTAVVQPFMDRDALHVVNVITHAQTQFEKVAE